MTKYYYYPELHPKTIEKYICNEIDSSRAWVTDKDSWTRDWIQEEIALDFYEQCGGDWTTGTQEFTVYDENMNKLMEFTAEIDYEPRFWTKEIDE